MRTTELQFEWSNLKSASNERKHDGISFREAQTVFADDLARLIPDPDHSYGEERFIILGMSARSRLLIVCHCQRRRNTIRIISARKADSHERKQYEEFTHA
uniref:Uncharacterized protein n=1 Tax=Candidatus Kentrum sp. FM TaxID=2126340 RepID=A0A450S7W1_9GAMM|nr:MAG: hypothetical protein BECKFM1743C_GA0114222_100526 [Candidatus Kentron sp. FM]VFJ60717.1 MAG: hypothetical protein BECKFM1743A_GA0114220_102701 [Candidatus Kentron sp. FM]VFK07918.1 MAG: hypothetical protein BECKFM1743B_GA0114221_100536 [Candidatus Kentron sp. FM]